MRKIAPTTMETVADPLSDLKSTNPIMAATVIATNPIHAGRAAAWWPARQASSLYIVDGIRRPRNPLRFKTPLPPSCDRTAIKSVARGSAKNMTIKVAVSFRRGLRFAAIVRLSHLIAANDNRYYAACLELRGHLFLGLAWRSRRRPSRVPLCVRDYASHRGD